jgi:predicted small lipoprotein YifL
MKHTLYTFTVLAVLLGICACKDGEQGPLIPPSSEYQSWEQTIGVILDYPIPGHEDNSRRIFINRAGTEVAVQRRQNKVYWDYPRGTIIIKEIFQGLEHKEADLPFQITAMIKDPEDPRSRGGWLWVAKNLETEEETVVDWEFCVDCHANANEPHPYGDKNEAGEFRDYVYFPYKTRQDD